jgi:squalene-hopene/tetraprenyl-beta-curcumene cyclase
MPTRLVALFAVAITTGFSQDWNPRLAERYMDSRLQEWVSWPMALHSGVACVSCHTGLPYLLARPALRQALDEKGGPTLYEAVLVDSMRATVIRTDAKDLFEGLKGVIVDQVYGAQVVLSALVLAMDDAPRGRLSPEGEKAFARMWSIQVKTGPDKGAWQWSDFDLDPWETKDSAFYGAALGALATGMAPANYQSRSNIKESVAALTVYLRQGQKSQLLHNRLFLLWASAKMLDLLPDNDKESILQDLWSKQEADGGWTLESLGPWKKRDNVPPAVGSNSYATALAAFAAGQAGIKPSQANLARALAWLKAHQDAQSGSWSADSMNHKRSSFGSIPDKFMSDAATGYATAALLATGDSQVHAAAKPRN